MMRIFKRIMLFLIALLIILLVVAAFISGDCKYEKTISINAPVERVWQNTNTLKAMDQWSPWNDLDPDMKKTGQAQRGSQEKKFAGTVKMKMQEKVVRN